MRILFSLARKPLLGHLIGCVFVHLSFLLPVERIYETKKWLVFYHPKPSYPVHILLVPKKQIASLSEIRAADHPLLLEGLRIAEKIAASQNLQQAGYQLVINAGDYQDVAQIHFHLISGQN